MGTHLEVNTFHIWKIIKLPLVINDASHKYNLTTYNQNFHFQFTTPDEAIPMPSSTQPLLSIKNGLLQNPRSPAGDLPPKTPRSPSSRMCSSGLWLGPSKGSHTITSTSPGRQQSLQVQTPLRPSSLLKRILPLYWRRVIRWLISGNIRPS